MLLICTDKQCDYTVSLLLPGKNRVEVPIKVLAHSNCTTVEWAKTPALLGFLFLLLLEEQLCGVSSTMPALLQVKSSKVLIT